MSGFSSFPSHEPNSYEWCLERFVVGEDERLSAVAKVACDRWGVWPEQLVGRELAGNAARDVTADDLLVGTSYGPSRLPYVVLARRVAWNLSHEFTGMSAAELGDVFGGFRAGTVKPYIGDTIELQSRYVFRERPIEGIIGELSLLASVELIGSN